MNRWLTTGTWLLAVLCATATSSASLITEGSTDAGDLPGTARDISNLTVTQITGTITVDYVGYGIVINPDVDMYKITITDPAAFSATTDDNSTGFDTMLFLFDAAGKAVYMNDDIDKGGFFFDRQSLLPAGHALGPKTAGDYYLAVTGHVLTPRDEDNSAVFETGSTKDVFGPSLSIKPVDNWQKFTFFASGDYQIDLTGVGGTVIPEPSSLAAWSVLGLGLCGIGWWRRRGRPV